MNEIKAYWAQVRESFDRGGQDFTPHFGAYAEFAPTHTIADEALQKKKQPYKGQVVPYKVAKKINLIGSKPPKEKRILANVLGDAEKIEPEEVQDVKEEEEEDEEELEDEYGERYGKGHSEDAKTEMDESVEGLGPIAAGKTQFLNIAENYGITLEGYDLGKNVDISRAMKLEYVAQLADSKIFRELDSKQIEKMMIKIFFNPKKKFWGTATINRNIGKLTDHLSTHDPELFMEVAEKFTNFNPVQKRLAELQKEIEGDSSDDELLVEEKTPTEKYNIIVKDLKEYGIALPEKIEKEDLGIDTDENFKEYFNNFIKLYYDVKKLIAGKSKEQKTNSIYKYLQVTGEGKLLTKDKLMGNLGEVRELLTKEGKSGSAKKVATPKKASTSNALKPVSKKAGT